MTKTEKRFDPTETIAKMPESPGVYLMKNHQGEIVYIGKARSLKARVRSYFSGGDTRPFVQRLSKILAEIEVILTDTEAGALILENNLIKTHKPRYNVMLRDDKSYLSLRIDPRSHWPRVEVTRRRHARSKKDTGRYFGPYHSAKAIRQTLQLLGRHFMLRTCPDRVLRNRSRPCLQYQIKRCPAPCVLDVDASKYGDHVQETVLFLEGKTQELSARLRARMMESSDALEFEAAGRYRDQIRAIEKAMQPQHAERPNVVDQDAFGHYREGDRLTIQALYVRGGRLEGTRVFSLKDHDVPDEEVYSSLLNLYYQAGNIIPNEILLPVTLEDASSLSDFLSGLRQRKVQVQTPKRGHKKKLVESACRNAEHTFKSQRLGTEQSADLLEKLQKSLKLSAWPERIECFDISNLQDSHMVGSMVVFEGGTEAPQQYRHFKIKRVKGQNDFASMYEVLERRFKRTLDGDWPKPDLVVIDGGKGQLGQAVTILSDLGIHDVDVISLAKSRVESDMTGTQLSRSPERVFLPGRKNPVVLRQNSAEIFLLQRLRDEAHRFAITFHRKQRRKATFKSALDDIAGIGPKKRRALLSHFGSTEKIRNATTDELKKVDGISEGLAKEVFSFFNSAEALDL